MALSPAHQFGQIIGSVLERAIGPGLKKLAEKHGLYFDEKGKRAVREKRTKVAWLDLHGNTHELDFVFERFGTVKANGAPVAFIEAAWRRYTKHSKNKAQEIQGAIVPLAAKYACHAPFVGVVLAGDYTQPSLDQLRTNGFHVVHIEYQSVLKAFSAAGMDAAWDEKTKSAELERKVNEWKALTADQQQMVIDTLVRDNIAKIEELDRAVEKAVTRRIERVVVLPLHGREITCHTVGEAIKAIEQYDENAPANLLARYEIQIFYTNKDKIDGEFRDRSVAIDFLKNYLPDAELLRNLPVELTATVIGGSPVDQPEPEPTTKKKPRKK